MTCKKQQETDRTENGVKVFLRYVDDIFGTIECDPGVVLKLVRKGGGRSPVQSGSG